LAKTGKPRSTKPKPQGLKRLAPTEPAARDEGPRLLPLSERAKEPSRLEHYLDLADSALGKKEDTRNKELAA
jgi:hypothetical protein